MRCLQAAGGGQFGSETERTVVMGGDLAPLSEGKVQLGVPGLASRLTGPLCRGDRTVGRGAPYVHLTTDYIVTTGGIICQFIKNVPDAVSDT